ncbi:MAG: hypothetical protein JWN40_3116 [Phycisphaerales bacterium]|nr:hypothetical protein [Phycisphaerales bacterium]
MTMQTGGDNAAARGRANRWGILALGGKRGAWAAVLVFLGMFGGRAAATSVVAPSIESSVEWSVVLADRVVRGTVRPGMQRDLFVLGVRLREVTLDVEETIKGEPLEQVVFLMDAAEPLGKVEKSWADVLVFLDRVAGGVEANKASDRLGGWRAPRGLVFVLDQTMPVVYRMDGTVVADAEGLLKTVREAGAFGRSAAATEQVQVYCDASPLWLGHRILIVPKDQRIERIAKGWLECGDATLRARGIDVIGNFRSAENAGRLRRLFADPMYRVREAREWSPKLEERTWKDYPLRNQAVRQVANWNELGDAHAEVEAPFLQYVPAYWRGWAVGFGLIVAVALLWPGRWGSPGLGGRGAIVGLGLVVIVAMIWWRSIRADEAYSFAGGGGADYEVVSAWGRVAVLRVQDQAPPHGWMVRRFTWEENSGGPWFAHLLLPGEEVARAGFYAGEGRTVGAGGYSYRLIELPYWAVMAVVGAWPAMWGLGCFRRARRRRRWLRGNRCGRCGYDLRGHTGEGRCPECGEENAAALRRVGRGAVLLLLFIVPAEDARARVRDNVWTDAGARVARAEIVGCSSSIRADVFVDAPPKSTNDRFGIPDLISHTTPAAVAAVLPPDWSYHEIHPAKFWEPQVDWRERRYYPARYRAPHTVYETANPTYFPPAWGKWISSLAGLMIGGILWQRRGRLKVAAVRWGLISIGVGVVVVWWRSGRECDLLSWAPGDGTNYEVASVDGRLSLLCVNDGVGRQEMVQRSITLDATSSRRPWYLTMLLPKAEAKGWGFLRSRGEIQTDPWTKPYWMVEMPYWPLAGVVLAWPLWAFVRSASGMIRVYRLRKAGRCTTCGYDLRSSAGRCPECGATNLRRAGIESVRITAVSGNG